MRRFAQHLALVSLVILATGAPNGHAEPETTREVVRSQLQELLSPATWKAPTLEPLTSCNGGTIGCGGSASGRVSVDSCVSDGIYAVLYTFHGQQGQKLTISARSFDFKMVLALSDEDVDFFVHMEASRVGGTATLTATLPHTGVFYIMVTPMLSAVFGDYTVSVSCTTAPPSGGSCSPTDSTACLLNGRFKARLKYRSAFDNGLPDTQARVKSVSGFGSSNYETVFFYFNSDSNIEVLLKMLDQGNVNSQNQPTIAVLYGTATPLGVELVITDTLTNATRTFKSNFNEMKGETDFTAFVK